MLSMRNTKNDRVRDVVYIDIDNNKQRENKGSEMSTGMCWLRNTQSNKESGARYRTNVWVGGGTVSQTVVCVYIVAGVPALCMYGRRKIG